MHEGAMRSMLEQREATRAAVIRSLGLPASLMGERAGSTALDALRQARAAAAPAREGVGGSDSWGSRAVDRPPTHFFTPSKISIGV